MTPKTETDLLIEKMFEAALKEMFSQMAKKVRSGSRFSHVGEFREKGDPADSSGSAMEQGDDPGRGVALFGNVFPVDRGEHQKEPQTGRKIDNPSQSHFDRLNDCSRFFSCLGKGIIPAARTVKEDRIITVKEKLAPIQETIESTLSGLKMLKDSIERGQIPFVERDYFNLAMALERVEDAKERLAGILQRD